jgi:hypothetical protein
MEFEEFVYQVGKSKHLFSKRYYMSFDELTKYECDDQIIKQTPEDFLKNGCPNCASICMHNRPKCQLCQGEFSTFDEFIMLSKQRYGDKYRYKDLGDKVRFNCSRHLPRDIKKEDHLGGMECIYCPQHPKQTEFINKLISKHGFKYNYHQINYVNINTKILFKDEMISPKKII